MSDKILVVEMPGKRLYREGDTAIKEFDGDRYSKADILNEALNQARVEETDLNIPRITAVEVVNGKWSIFMDYIEGVTLNKLKDKMQGRISMADLDATTRYDLHTRLDALPKHLNLCHGDFHPCNIIIASDGTPYIIDWAHATQGNSSADVARTYLSFYLDGKKDLAEKYLDLYCKKSDTAKQYVQKWIPIVAASRLTKAKPGEDEFLRSWIGVVDYQ